MESNNPYSKKSVEQVIAVNEISADRVDYFTFENQDEIELLLKGLKSQMLIL